MTDRAYIEDSAKLDDEYTQDFDSIATRLPESVFNNGASVINYSE